MANFRLAAVLAGFVVAPSCGPLAAPDVSDLQGRAVDALADSAPVTVLVFTRRDCPIANRYAPELARLHAAYDAADVRFWLVFADDREAVDSVRAYLQEFGVSIPALLDPTGALVRRAGVSISPEAAVFAAGGRLVYRGRIDDRFPKLGVSRPYRERDLKNAIDAALEGSADELVTTPAVGCYLSDLH